MAITKVGENQAFSYTGGVQSFTVPFTGIYKLEVWGAQGGTSLNNNVATTAGGKGGYSIGYIKLKKNDNLYICVGGKGGTGVKNGTATGGYNGGGTGSNDGKDDECGGGGGGATHIAKGNNRGILKNYSSYKSEILIVAGGGGGSSWTYTPGTGGGTNGGTSSGTSSSYPTQSSGYAFGQGQNGSGAADSDGCGGGGGGYYGGYANNVAAKSSGTGGSGYIGGVPTFTYKGTSYASSTSNGARSGNGAATITFMAKTFPTMYLGSSLVDGAYLGTTELNDFYIGSTQLS